MLLRLIPSGSVDQSGFDSYPRNQINMNMIKYHFIDGSSKTFIVNFSSKGFEHDAIVIPEFVNTYKTLDVSALCVMDMAKGWYQSVESTNEIPQKIREYKSSLNPERTIYMGLSMGGTGAILMSHFEKADLEKRCLLPMIFTRTLLRNVTHTGPDWI